MFRMDSTVKDYNETLRKVSLAREAQLNLSCFIMWCPFGKDSQYMQISRSLENSLETFGPSSIQYHAILEILQDCLRDIEEAKRRSSLPNVDPDVLSLAMGFLNIAG